MPGPPSPWRPGRAAPAGVAALAPVVAVVAVAVVAVAVVVVAVRAGGDGGGRDGATTPGPDLGSPHDAAALGRAVGTALGDTGEARPPSPDTICAGEVRATYGQGLGPMVYAARLRWQGTPAVLLAYRLEGAQGGLDHRAFVVSSDGCQLLVVQTL